MRKGELDDLFLANAYPVHARVRVVRGPRKGEVGTVDRTWADGGDMVHRCRFDDGTTANFDVDEIMATTKPTTN